MLFILEVKSSGLDHMEQGHPGEGAVTLDDYLAKLNLEGARNVWAGNRPKIEYVLRRTISFLPKNGSIMEVGIGSGYLLDRLNDRGFKCTGFDISSYLIEYHTKRVEETGKDISFIQGDITDPPYGIGPFDAIFALDILEHIDEAGYLKALEKMNGLLAQRGVLIGTVPNEENLSASMVRCPECGHEFHRVGHQQRFDLAKLTSTLEPTYSIEKMGVVRLSGLSEIARIARKMLKYPGERFAPRDTIWFIARKKDL